MTQRFATAFTARVDEDTTRPPRMRFFYPDSSTEENKRFGKLVFPVRGADGTIAPDSIFEIVQAASAFPLAFQPKRLTLYHPEEGTVHTDLFMDGGVFDNNPLGLAIDLFADANPKIMTNGRRDVIDVIYVTPGRYRQPLDSLRTRAPSALAWGGAMATIQMLGGAVTTAQQYELQLTVRQPRIGAPDTLAIQLTSRVHPITGEHLSHFGAFLARPFREYDFFVGVYDALHFVVSEYTCAQAASGRPKNACVAETIAAFLAEPKIKFGTVAPPLLDTLFATEFRDAAFANARGSVRRKVEWGPTLDDSARTTVLLALHAALQKTQLDAPAEPCGNLPLPHLLICADRLEQLLDEFGASPGVVNIIERWSTACRVQAKTLSRSQRNVACQGNAELQQLVSNPRKFASRVIDRLFERLWDVEHRVHRDFKNRARGEDSLTLRGVNRLDAELQAALLLSIYRARPLRPRYGFEWSPTSAPQRARTVHYAVPYYLAFNVGDSGFELGYRPTWHVNQKVGVTFPLTAHWTTPVIRRDDGTVSFGEGKDFFPGLGVGLAASGLIPRPLSLVIPEFGGTVQFMGPTSASWTDRGAYVTDVYTDVALLAGRLRIAARYANKEGQLFDGGNWAWSVGIADLNGLAYWLVRLRR